MRRPLTALVAGALLVTACASGTADSTSTSAAGSTIASTIAPTTTTMPATTTTTVPAPEIEILGQDYSFADVPTEPVPLGTTLSLTNTSDAEFHSMAIGYFGDDLVPLEELATLGLWELIFAGELTSVLFAMPGEEHYGRLTGSGWREPILNRAGRWVIFCNVSMGSDPEELRTYLETSDQPPFEIEGALRHHELGMIAEIWVEAS